MELGRQSSTVGLLRCVSKRLFPFVSHEYENIFPKVSLRNIVVEMKLKLFRSPFVFRHHPAS